MQIGGIFSKNIPPSKRSVSHCGLAIYIKKSILRQKKNYGNSNISKCKKYSLQKKPKSFKIL
jgi:hypothetical protein